jgi:hypothetical protein
MKLTLQRAKEIKMVFLDEIERTRTIPGGLVQPFWEFYSQEFNPGEFSAMPCTCSPKLWSQMMISVTNAVNEAFAEDGRIPLDQALDELHKLCWKCNRIWMNGPTYDANILEHAYKSYGKPLPWQYYKIRDARTVYSLYPGLPRPVTSHHALEDCRRQIDMLQTTLKHLGINNVV